MSEVPDRIVRERIDDWRRHLIDLSYRNRLIKYRPTVASTIEIETPELEVLLADIGARKPWRFFFPPEPTEDEAQLEIDAAKFVDEVVVQSARGGPAPQADEIVVRGEMNPRRINRTLENLARKSNAEYQDKALRILYVAAGFLDWVDPTRGEALSSPLILVPVELRRQAAGQPYGLHFVDDEEVVVNPSLTEKLRRDLKLDVPEDWVWEDKPIETELSEIEQAVARHGWVVRRDAVIGLFSFQKFVMYRDLLAHEAQIATHPVVRSLAENTLVDELVQAGVDMPGLDQLDDVQRPHDDFSILDADATQRLCIEATRRGQSFVMQGPPGTGKSQTIANLIADSIGRGKRILFVSEKAAALDVVHKRLAAQGLDEYCLLLHGEHAARREVVEELNRCLSSQIVPRQQMTAHELDRLADLREVLNSSVLLAHLPAPQLADRSPWDVLGELAQLYDARSIPLAPEASAAQGAEVRSEFQQVDEIFHRLAERWHVSPEAFPWKGFALERFTTDDHGRLAASIQRLTASVEGLERQSGDVARLLGWPAPINVRAVDGLLALGEHLGNAPPLRASWVVPGGWQTVSEAAAEARETLEAREAGTQALAELWVGRASTDFPGDPARELDETLQRLADAVGRTPNWENGLVEALPRLHAFLVASPKIIEEVIDTVAEAAQVLGQPLTKLSVEAIRDLADLAALAFRTEDRPDPDWLVRAGLQRALEALDEVGDRLQSYQVEQHRLLAEYTDTSLVADTGGLRDRFASNYGSFLARLSRAYRTDAKAVKALRRDGRVPEDVARDLDDLERLAALGRELDSIADRLERAFGSYFAGLKTDVGAVRRACATATRILEVADPKSDLALLAGQVAIGSKPDARIAQLSDRLNASLSYLGEGIELAGSIAGRRAQVLPTEDLRALDQSLRRLAGAIEGVASSVQAIEAASREPVLDLTTLGDRAALVTALHRTERVVQSEESRWAELLGALYRGVTTDWQAVTGAIEWLRGFDELVGSAPPQELQSLLVSPERRLPDFAGLRGARDLLLGESRKLEEMFDEQRQVAIGQRARQSDFQSLRHWIGLLRDHLDDLNDWVESRSWRARATDRGWGLFVDALVEAELPGGDVVPAYRRAFWNRRLEVLFEEEPSLADRGATYARWIEEFKSLDRRLVLTAADRLISARNSERPPQVAFRGSQTDLLRREGAKKKRHMPVRKLLAAIPTVLSELKPCLMMSPLTVSHFLAPDHDFDLVVFDEASQVPPQDAINCIYRGRQLIVAGDSRQLPPTPFFQVAEVEGVWDENDDSVSEDMESILDACEALLPAHPLRWHYRSKHEQLIAFSNQYVYDRGLHTFPSADVVSSAKGVRFLHVPDGVYERGRSANVNRREAKVVAERVVEHLRAGRTSVGVIAFNTQQSDTIAQELERLRIEHPELEEHFSGDRLESVFVKHLESVQGDERDVIVFSVGFGRDADGKFTMNFGPLNKEGGFRRLNVAVTRARELVEVVASIHSADFSLTDSSSRGARLLKDYIHYAETRGRSLAGGEETSEFFASPLETEIARAIEGQGLEAEAQIGVGSFRVDVGVRSTSGDRYLLGVTADGPVFSRTPTARDRERLREDVLANLGWHTHRVWALDWVRNRNSEIERLNEALGHSMEGVAAPLDDDDPDLPPRERADRMVVDLLDAVDATHFDWVAEYQRIDLPRHRSNYEFHESVNRDAQRDLIIALALGEAPIHSDYAIRRLAREWGLRRVGGRIRPAAQQAIKMAERRGLIELRGAFIWLPQQQLTYVRSPRWTDDRTFRSIEEIPPEEIDLAFERLSATGVTEEAELIPVVAKILGFDRVGGKIRPLLEARFLALQSRAGSD